MSSSPVLAAIDLGSNSFRLQFARVEHGQLVLIDGLREPVRLAGGLDANGDLEPASRDRALACLNRFRELLEQMAPNAVRVVATNTLRIANNSAEFLPQAEAALGLPIEIIPGTEEARLIYLGVAHSLPATFEKRLVMDIGGGSTEFIIGSGFATHRLTSLQMGCVGYSRRFFPDGRITADNLAQAVSAAHAVLQPIIDNFSQANWDIAYGSAGTACVVGQILKLNGYSDGNLTRSALDAMYARLIELGNAAKLDLTGIKPDRVPVLPGGFAILYAVFLALGIERMHPAESALREGVLQDLLSASGLRDK
ncbi:Guanosine-5'-triphosphate,3'-diphosphate pyrophosphatase [Ferriphaselus amnicola]|uniref:exopolyphosphatase n=1 Tax=Ferriphaselus amnicola TaxID=1188319 RepID=A0A2Z6GEL4_9PROT|nr:exopolyphosphatase [Ferriphaselus amnicola]BBE52026.1 Guanosine-5'-triphosphate,3'-diphosphate pyrophosphatase [Ferriphaselus amnicola]